MKAIVAIIVLLALLVGVNYSITGNVVGVGEEESPGFFKKIWNFFKELFFDDVEKDVRAVAEVAISILPSNEGDLGELVVCAMDARVCADGSYVVRSGPDCEFEVCPN